MSPTEWRRVVMVVNVAFIGALTLACAGRACPEGWSKNDSRCEVKSSHLRRVERRIGATGAFGAAGHYGTGAPPTGAGGGFVPWTDGRIELRCVSGSCAGTVPTTTNDKGQWEVALLPGEYDVYIASLWVVDSGPADTSRVGSLTVRDGELTELLITTRP